MMMKGIICVILIAGLLSLPGSSVSTPAKKTCCHASQSGQSCPRCGGDKSDCCQYCPEFVLVLLDVSKSVLITHPPMPRFLPSMDEYYPPRMDAPPVPPPKGA